MRRPSRIPASSGEPRYLRPGGNRKVRRRRRARAALRAILWCAAWLAGAGLASVGFSEGWRLMSDPDRFPVGRVIVRGGTDEVHREVSSALAPMMGQNIFTADLEAAGRRAREHRWVGWARVQRRLPSSLLVTLALRSVEALVHEGSGIRMLAPDGSDLGPYDPALAGGELPVITGVAATTREETLSRLRRGLKSMRRLKRESPAFTEALSTLDVSRPDRLVGTMRDFRPAIYLSVENPSLNLDHLASVRTRLEAGGLRATYVDLRFRDRVAVRLDRRERNHRGA